MLKLVPVEFNSDAAFIAECLDACREQLESPVVTNIPLTVAILEARTQAGVAKLFVGHINAHKVGLLLLDLYDDGSIDIHGLLLPDERGRGRAWSFLRGGLDYCFDQLKAYKVRAKIKLEGKGKGKGLGVERLLRHAGFRKEGILKQEWQAKTGRCDKLLISLLASDYQKSHDSKTRDEG